jgi:FkbM family methyltransferase
VTGSGKVIAFEPNPTVAQRLRENCALNRIRNVELLPFACSRSGGGSGILIVNRDSNPTGHLQSRERGTWENSSRLRDLISVEVTTLDKTLVSCDRVDFIKIDVDGGEYDVLLGGERVLERCHPHLLIEYSEIAYAQSGANWDQLRAFLKALGYRIYLVDTFRGRFSHLAPIVEAPPRDGDLFDVP